MRKYLFSLKKKKGEASAFFFQKLKGLFSHILNKKVSFNVEIFRFFELKKNSSDDLL